MRKRVNQGKSETMTNSSQTGVRAPLPTPPLPRDYNGVNWRGMMTLYAREVRRLWKVGMQTVAAPVVTTLLYMLIFVVAMRGASPPIHGTAYAQFVAPGLIMMAI